ncbi:MAG: hypothetical protein H0W20_01090 [Chthoniobacterales bacterium]|nr:hypothetical protein [Chthoniobacterales bacterium]
MFVGETGDEEVAVIEFDNPPVVLALPTLLGNISTRARVGTGDDALIGGFMWSDPQVRPRRFCCVRSEVYTLQ